MCDEQMLLYTVSRILVWKMEAFPVKVILKRGSGKKEKNEEDEPNWCKIYVCMETSQ
jgi:hypothetical protein